MFLLLEIKHMEETCDSDISLLSRLLNLILQPFKIESLWTQKTKQEEIQKDFELHQVLFMILCAKML